MQHSAKRVLPARLGLLFTGILALGVALPQTATAQDTGNGKAVMDDHVYTFFMADQLEHRWNQGENSIYWDAQGWIGGDYNKLWLKTEGESLAGRAEGEAEVQALYSRAVSPYWDFQAGIRHDRSFGMERNASRSFAVLGFQGLAPYWFDVEPALFISEDGDISARLTAEYDVLLTQRLIAQPRLELNASARKVEEFEVGSGINDLDIGLRLRYEIRREFAPYVGVSWNRRFGQTADMARSAGNDVDNTAILAGVRIWY